MKEIKLMIDGKEVALTKEQIKALGIDVDDGCVCDMVKEETNFWYADEFGIVRKDTEEGYRWTRKLYDIGNYYRDESYAKQVALHQKLNNLLRRFSEQHGGDCEWDVEHNHFPIGFDFEEKKFYVGSFIRSKQCGVVYFGSRIAAENAIEEVVKPFMEEHPEFVW